MENSFTEEIMSAVKQNIEAGREKYHQATPGYYKKKFVYEHSK
jgi:hypothetical protein